MELQKRIIIYPKDVALITGRNERYARKVLSKVRIYFEKSSHHPVTIKEYCEYCKIRMDEVEPMLL
ncbi:MAG: hypothetical protein WAT37_18655 [Saprospiraceae bacterium]|nr:hypothetical protein [Saprospiraceae bacterium]MBK8052947.1 hypothetical protein [Saprospiraceae bacterium]